MYGLSGEQKNYARDLLAKEKQDGRRKAEHSKECRAELQRGH